MFEGSRGIGFRSGDGDFDEPALQLRATPLPNLFELAPAALPLARVVGIFAGYDSGTRKKALGAGDERSFPQDEIGDGRIDPFGGSEEVTVNRQL